MRTACRSLLGLLALATLVSAAPVLRQSEKKPTIECRTVTTGAAIQFFSTAISSAVMQDRKGFMLQSMDITYATTSIRISTWAATTDAQGWPVIGFAQPYQEWASQSRPVFVRRTSSPAGQASVEVCGQQLE